MVDKPDSKVKALNSVYRLENGTDLQFIKSPYVLCIMFGSFIRLFYIDMLTRTYLV